MTAATPRRPVMFLPAADDASGEVTSPPLIGDVRIPVPFGRDDFEPRLVAYWRRTEQCPTGRHLWDAIVVSSYDDVPFIADDDVERRRFRMKLTCVRCGLVDDFRGIAEDDGASRTARVDPAPLRSGRLFAQQVDGDRGGRRDTSSWAVHDDPETAPVGFISWGRGPRGGRYFSGTLYAWPSGVSVRAAAPEACLAKLAKAPAGGPA